jgi:hypothetical protein
VTDRGALRLDGDGLKEDLDRQPPRLPRGGLALTTSAAHSLERAQRISPRAEYVGPSGRPVPLVRAGARRAGRGPRLRNPEIFGRPTPLDRSPAPDVRARGILDRARPARLRADGRGKTRLVAEALTRHSESTLWVDLGASRAQLRPSLAAQIFAQASLLAGSHDRRTWSEDRHEWHELVARRHRPRDFAERLALATWAWLRRHQGPVRLVIDGMEGASPQERELLTRLSELPQLGRSLRLVLMGRRGSWESGWPAAPVVSVESLDEAEAAALAGQLTHALGLPQEVIDRLATACGRQSLRLRRGHPAAHPSRPATAGLRQFLLRRRARRGFTPTPRLVRQVRAEADRLGATEPLRLLAAAGQALPGAELADPASGWQKEALRSSWLRDRHDTLGTRCRMAAAVRLRPVCSSRSAPASGTACGS